jgi:tetratricopeptide (TPR) repeat protein
LSEDSASNWARISASLASYSEKARAFISGHLTSDKAAAEANGPDRLIVQAGEPTRKQHFAGQGNPGDAPAAGPDAPGQVPKSSGNVDAAAEAYSTVLRIALDRKDWQSYSEAALALCELYMQARQIEKAILHAELSLAVLASAALASEGKIRVENPKLLLDLGVCLAILDKPERSRAALALARGAFEARCDHFLLSRVFDTLARLAKREGDVVSMRRCVGSAMLHEQTARDFVGIAATMAILDEKDRFPPPAGSRS